MNEKHFLQAVLANPEDEVTRQAFADWLLEQGDAKSNARGEFIQVQCQLARYQYGNVPAQWADAERIPELKRRESELIHTHGKDWVGPLLGIVDTYQFARGFVDSITIEPGDFLRHAAKIYAHSPVRKVRFSKPINPAVISSAWLARVVELDLSATQMGDILLQRLLTDASLTSLKRLNLNRCYLTDRGLAHLANSPVLAQLDVLDLGYNYLGLPGIRGLFGSPHWGKVRELTLTGNYYIDSRAQEYICQTLQGSPDPALLRVMLQTASREERQYTGTRTRELARRAGENTATAPDVLAEGLRDGNRKLRSAAAHLLGRIGASGMQAAPLLVQHLFEETPHVRDHAAPALARLIPELSAEMQRWLCVLANPLLPARSNLMAAIDSGQLPGKVMVSFAELCARRMTWWQRLLKKTVPGPITHDGSPSWVEYATKSVMRWAGQHLARHHTGGAKTRQQTRGENREAAWLLARMMELLQAEFPPKANQHPVMSPVKARRGRWK